MSDAHLVEPMPCLAVKKSPESEAWQYELKLDGYRALAVKHKGQGTLFPVTESCSTTASRPSPPLSQECWAMARSWQSMNPTAAHRSAACRSCENLFLLASRRMA